jgi:hypothetical protein
MKNLKYAFVALLLSVPAISNAAFFFEPGVTYQSHDIKVMSGLGDSSGTNKGLGVGLRLGTHFSDILFAGVDARYAMTKFEDSSANSTVDAKNMDLSPFIGVQMPIVGLRLWGAYTLWGEIDPDSSGGIDPKLSKASGLRLGAGFHILMVSLNLEYQDLKYDDVSAGTPLGTIDLDHATSKGVSLGVSFPLSF